MEGEEGVLGVVGEEGGVAGLLGETQRNEGGAEGGQQELSSF